jgi:hypothetical protein
MQLVNEKQVDLNPSKHLGKVTHYILQRAEIDILYSFRRS